MDWNDSYRDTTTNSVKLIESILAHLNGKAPSAGLVMLPEERAPPQARLFD